MSEAGNVASAKIITDRQTGQPRGFGFVEMETKAEGQKAISMLNGKNIDGRALAVNEARPQQKSFGGGGGGGGGGAAMAAAAAGVAAAATGKKSSHSEGGARGRRPRRWEPPPPPSNSLPQPLMGLEGEEGRGRAACPSRPPDLQVNQKP